MANIGSYEERIKDFSWTISEKELGYENGKTINIGWYCSDRICELGKADKLALIWEGMGGKEKTFTFNEVRLASNTIGAFLKELGINNGDRACLFLDKVVLFYF